MAWYLFSVQHFHLASSVSGWWLLSAFPLPRILLVWLPCLYFLPNYWSMSILLNQLWVTNHYSIQKHYSTTGTCEENSECLWENFKKTSQKSVTLLPSKHKIVLGMCFPTLLRCSEYEWVYFRLLIIACCCYYMPLWKNMFLPYVIVYSLYSWELR